MKDEINQLQETIFTAKRKQDDNCRDLEVRVREDEYSKYHSVLLDIEGKIKGREDERIFADNKYYDTITDIQQMMKHANDTLI